MTRKIPAILATATASFVLIAAGALPVAADESIAEDVPAVVDESTPASDDATSSTPEPPTVAPAPEPASNPPAQSEAPPPADVTPEPEPKSEPEPEPKPEPGPPPPAEKSVGAAAGAVGEVYAATNDKEYPGSIPVSKDDVREEDLVTKVWICHSPSSKTNPWVSQNPNINSLHGPNGHANPSANDTHEEDIIPAYYFQGQPPQGGYYYFPGKNLDTLFNGVKGSEILKNGCAVPSFITPGAWSTDQKCIDGRDGGMYLQGGFITVKVDVPVTYTIKNSSNETIPFDPASGKTGELPPGKYTVTAVDADPNDGKILKTSPWVKTLKIKKYKGECEEPDEIIQPNYKVKDLKCVDVTPNEITTAALTVVGGRIWVDVSQPLTFVITDASDTTVPFDSEGWTDQLPAGNYLITVSDPIADDGVTIDPNPSEIPVEITQLFEGECADPDEIIEPVVLVFPQDCVPEGEGGVDQLVPGYIYVNTDIPVVYEIRDESDTVIEFNAESGMTGGLQPGTYTVTVTDALPDDGYGLENDPTVISVTVEEYDGDCGPGVLPGELVTPTFSWTPLTCEANGSFTLGNIGAEPADNALTWTVNGEEVAEGTYVVDEPTVIEAIATANEGWEIAMNDGVFHAEFEEPEGGCVDPQELAHTGSDPASPLAIAGLLAALGAFLIFGQQRRRASAN